MLAQKRSSKIELVLVSNKRICMTCYYNYDTNIWAWSSTLLGIINQQYEKNSQGIIFLKCHKLSNETIFMQKKSFLAILEQKTQFEKKRFFAFFVKFWKIFKILKISIDFTAKTVGAMKKISRAKKF